MSFPAYDHYKDTGAEWLGLIPAHWDHMPARRLFSQIREPARDDDEQLSATQRYGVIPQSLFMALEDQKVVLALKGTDAFKHVDQDDFVISLRSFQGGIERSTYSGCVSPAYTVLRPDHRVYAGFWAYLLKCMPFIAALQSATDGIREGKTISYDQFGSLTVSLPAAAEQRAIAAFLDRETAKIDALVEAQRRLIELLKEKRQAVISHAVTKGREPSAPMKDSGVEWLGQVPVHWEIVPIKRVTQTIEQGWSPQCESYPVQSRDEWGVLKVGCVNGGRFSPEENKTLPAELDPMPELGICSGDLLVSRANTRELVGSAAVAEGAYPNLLLCDKLYRLRLDLKRCRPALLALFLGCREARSQIELAATGASSSMLNIGQAVVLELPLPLPSPDEQTEILDWLESELGKIDGLTAGAQAATAILQERRAALISAAVTGKIDVRGTAASFQEANAA